MNIKYTHLKLDKDLSIGIGGYYTPRQEVRLKYNGREVLYVTGEAVVETSCCNIGSWTYVIVPGYIVDWQNTESDDGLPVSKVEPVSDEETRKKIKKIIQDKEGTPAIEFWQV